MNFLQIAQLRASDRHVLRMFPVGAGRKGAAFDAPNVRVSNAASQ